MTAVALRFGPLTPAKCAPDTRGVPAEFRLPGSSGLGQFMVAAGLALLTTIASAGPEDGQISTGLGGISQVGTTITITQSSPQLSLAWKSFNIAANETVNFVQPSSAAIAVNRIADPNGTQILGRLNANGQVFLINPNGILFGRGAQLNVAGIVASTLDLHDATLNSPARSFSGPGSGSIINRGTIATTEGGYVALLGRTVVNQGAITAPLGAVALGGGSAATLTFSGNSLVGMQVDQGVLNSLAENGGLIRADGGIVVMSAGAKNELLASVVNNTGLIQARRVENRGGTIVLLGGMSAGTVKVAGTLDASAPNGGEGGFIETSAASVKVAADAKITTASFTGPAGTWLIDPVNFTIAASGGDTTGAALSANLAGGNVIIQSSTGGSGTLGDVNVNDTVAWSANKLTLNAQNNINLNANLNGSGTASLALEFGQGAVATGNASDVITTGAAVNLPASTTNFTTKQGSDGLVKNFTVITSLGAVGSVTTTDLQGMIGGLAGNYALGANINAAATSGWNSGAGFAPVGDNTTRFTGIFDGLGHTVTGLVLNRTGANPVALFGDTAIGAVVRNVGLIGGSVFSDSWGAGSLVGLNSGTVTNSYATGTVTGYHATGGLVGTNDGVIRNSYATGVAISYNIGEAGGLVGWNASPGSISNSHATGNVSSPAGNVGGLVGINFGSTSNSYATGTAAGGNDAVGGLVGWNTGPLSNSYATGAVNGINYVGGLIGNNSGTVTNSNSRGNVTSSGVYGGGFAGYNNGTITASFAISTIRGSTNVGGLVGRNQGVIQGSYAAGTLLGSNRLGGLAGVNSSSIANSYSTVAVTSDQAQQDLFGGLIGQNTGSVTNSYASGVMVVNTNNAGGLIGLNQGGTITSSYWNTQTTGQATSSGGTAQTTAQMQQQGNFTSWDFASTWTITNGLTFPLLQSLMTPLTVTANNDSRSYNGVAYSGGNGVTYSALVNGIAPTGTLSFGGTAQGKTGVGSYSITPGGLLSNQQYRITFVDGTLTINRAHLTVTAADASRLYGQANPTFTTTLTGFVNGESALTAAGLSGSGSATSTAGSATNIGTATISAGAGTLAATNYDFTNLVTGTLTINRAHLTVTAADANRLYGQANPTFTTTLTGFVNGESALTAAGLSGSGTATSTAANATNVGTATITAGAGTLAATNYDFTNLVNGTLTINPAALTVTANATSKIYDGQSFSGGNGVSYGGFVNGETSAVLGGTLSYAGTSQGARNAGSFVVTPQGLLGNNYALTFASGALTIDRAALSAAASVFEQNLRR